MTPDRVAIVGIGRLGLCLALNLERAGYDVLGIDRDRDRGLSVSQRTIRTPEPGVAEALRDAARLSVACDSAAAAAFAPGAVFVCVDTPTRDEGGYDASAVDAVLDALCEAGAPRALTDLILVSTVLPGYGDSRASSVAEHGYALSYSPGFVAQGTIMRDQQYPAMVLIGEADAEAGARVEAIYRRLILGDAPVHRMSRLAAEIAKLATNSFLTMKIAFANAIGDLAVSAGADPRDVLAAVGADPRIGPGCLAYGFGYGGPCFPRDNRALNAFARRYGGELLQAQATDVMNERHLAFQIREYLERHPAGDTVRFRSVAYKPGTDILDESQPLAVALAVAHAGRRVIVYDTEAVIEQLRARFGDLFEYVVEESG